KSLVLAALIASAALVACGKKEESTVVTPAPVVVPAPEPAAVVVTPAAPASDAAAPMAPASDASAAK
ncbi:MAG: hypothetical protein ABI343_12830, partial [Burkholderiaceae bacterium]